MTLSSTGARHLRTCRRDPSRRSGAVVGTVQWVLRPLACLAVARHWTGAENLPATGAAIVVGNHTGPFDALAYGHLLQAHGIPARFLGKHTLFTIPVLGTLLRWSRQIPVVRGDSRSEDALSAARAALGRGEVIVIFPEGSYTRDPDRWPMRGRTGAARLALETGAPVIPIACWGSADFWPVHARCPRLLPRRCIRMMVGPGRRITARPGESGLEAARRGTAEIQSDLVGHLARIRGERPPDVLHDPTQDHHRPEAGRA